MMRKAVHVALFALAATAAPGLVAPSAIAQEVLAPSVGVPALRPGEYVWFEPAAMTPASTAAGSEVTLVVSIPDQRAYVYRGGVLVGMSTVSTGKRGKETPVGDFTILQKKTFHRSNIYSNAPMPYMQRLTWGGIALHAGHLPGYPASHGCIRLPKAFARQLFAMTEMGGSVSVIGHPVVDPVRAPWPAPPIYADAGNLGGSAFDVVTVSESDVPRQPASWVTGPKGEGNRSGRMRRR